MCILVALVLAASPRARPDHCPMSSSAPPPPSCKIQPFSQPSTNSLQNRSGQVRHFWPTLERHTPSNVRGGIGGGVEQVCPFAGVVGLRQTCESVWRGGRPAAHSGPRTAARQPQRARCQPRIARCRHRTRPELRGSTTPRTLRTSASPRAAQAPQPPAPQQTLLRGRLQSFEGWSTTPNHPTSEQ